MAGVTDLAHSSVRPRPQPRRSLAELSRILPRPDAMGLPDSQSAEASGVLCLTPENLPAPVAITPWPQVEGLMLDRLGNWRVKRLLISARDFQDALQRARAGGLGRAFFNRIPPPVLAAAAQYGEHPLEVLRTISVAPASLDLHRHCPALVFLLARADVFLKSGARPHTCARIIQECATRTRRDLLQLAGFHPQGGNILAKLSPGDLSVVRLKRLRQMLQDSAHFKQLAHAATIPGDLLDVLWVGGHMLGARIRPHLERLDFTELGTLRMLLQDITVMRQHELIAHLGLPCFESLAAVRQCHDRWAADISYRGLRFRGPLPAPPLRGWAGRITPITTCEELYAEGHAMRHCVGCYAIQVRLGSHYVYRVLQPERATLSLQRIEGRWCLDELRGYGNRPVNRETLNAVKKWLVSHQRRRHK